MKIKPLRNKCYIRADKNKNHSIDIGGKKLFLATQFREYHEDVVCQDGEVVFAPVECMNGYDVEIKPGDKVYAHHFLCDDDQKVDFGEENLYEENYDNIYCVVEEDGSIRMLSGWNFVEPMCQEVKLSDNILAAAPDVHPTRGVLRHTNSELKQSGAKEDDVVEFMKNADYKILVGDKEYYRIKNAHILAILH